MVDTLVDTSLLSNENGLAMYFYSLVSLNPVQDTARVERKGGATGLLAHI